nr:immunoglobulin heavy chain junction region [Macaca mulatta]
CVRYEAGGTKIDSW